MLQTSGSAYAMTATKLSTQQHADCLHNLVAVVIQAEPDVCTRCGNLAPLGYFQILLTGHAEPGPNEIEVSYLKSQDGNGELGHGVGVLGQPGQHLLQVVWQNTARPQLFRH